MCRPWRNEQPGCSRFACSVTSSMNFARIRAELKSLSGGGANVLFRYRRKFLLTARFARTHPARACERHHRDLAPKRFDPGQGLMSVGCTLQNRIETGVLATRQQSRSERALRAASPAPIAPPLAGNGRDAIFMNRDVVEVAQAILHAFQPREELLPTFRRLLAREKAGEELRRISHLLGLDAQLMTAAGVEPGEHFAPLANLLEAARQLVGSGNLDGDVTTIADKVVLRSPPLPRLQPAS